MISATNKGTLRCSRCQTPLASEEVYCLPGDASANGVKGREERSPQKHPLCETCAMEARIHRRRKTHWQYLTSIKGDYLRPGKTALSDNS